METDAAAQRCEVLVAGPYFADLVFHGLARPVRPGTEVFADGFALVPGGAYTLAMALHRLGRRVTWSADFGTDLFSSHVLSCARQEGLDEAAFRHHPVPVRSLTVALASADDRAMVSFQDPVDAQPLAPLLGRLRPRGLVLPQLRWDDGTVADLRAARKLGTLVVMDCHDTPASLDDPAVRAALALVDVFTPNDAEALRLTGAGDLDGALGALAELVPTAVITRGAQGAVAVRDGRRHDAPPVSRVAGIDPTAAGDCFNAGLVHGLLNGWSLPDCLAAASLCGAAATTGPGSSAALHAADLDRHLLHRPDQGHLDPPSPASANVGWPLHRRT
ncbi:carbohydrate kinase family protein [Kitasatospora cathayae]|uniref:PfkB family carbohydrate kinase n=1 Tax=Kitasatospora cathayae TaxID=3004092 RepID=A0ABY7PZP5_9ACTN|nr:PfkB family carbohydrate kinase [Kitasatospora sp. HUAS 3-15]WBP85431.1 PfkB family carbohydrate kinase [Kitasatospora sp. HUAS 3-15]